MISIENQRLKEVREELGLTQTAMGEALELNTTADIERGRMRVPGRAVMLLLQKYQINPLWLFGESERKTLDPKGPSTMPQAIIVDSEDRENILMVQAKAAAGYGQNLGDEDYIRQLPAFSMPLPEYRHATFRGFQVTGDSMLPLVYPGDWVLTRAVESMDDVRDGKIYIIVERDSIRLKRVEKLKDKIRLISLNPDYPPVEVAMEEILEMWEYYSRISTSTDVVDQTPSLQQIQNELQAIKKKLM